MPKSFGIAVGFVFSFAFSLCAAGDYPVYKVADTSTQIPGAPAGQAFTSFDAPAARRNSVAPGGETAYTGFRATGPDGRIGLYEGASPPFFFTPSYEVFRVADSTSPVPGETEHFSDFSRPTFFNNLTTYGTVFTATFPSGRQAVYRVRSGESPTRVPPVNASASEFSAPSGMYTVAFTESAGVQTRISVFDGTSTASKDIGLFGPPSVSNSQFTGDTQTIAYGTRDEEGAPYSAIKAYSQPLTSSYVVASLGTGIPSGSGSFTSFGEPAAGSGGVLFRGRGAGGQDGIYRFGNSGREFIVDRTSVVPGRPGVTFASFSDPAVYGNEVLFLANLSDGESALYVPKPPFDPGEERLLELVSTSDRIDGKEISAIEISREAVGGALNADYVFKAEFTDGSEGIYMVRLPEPGIAFPSLATACLLARRYRPKRASK